jgi:selenoprotein W-related protein
MTRVTLEYCVPCDFRERALATQEAILTSLETELDSFELVMGDHGVFRVDVEGETVFDKEEDDFDTDEIVREIRQHV